MGSTPCLLYTILCVVFEARVINLCDRDIATKDPDEAMEYLDLLTENAQNWDTTGTYEAPGKT